MNIPADWLSETELAIQLGIPDGDRSKFHRNLENWRKHLLLPPLYQGLTVPQLRNLGFAIGNEAVYPPIVLPMLRRIDELRSQRPRDIDAWFWQLWIEGYPVDVIEWCRQRLEKLQTYLETDKKQLVETATRKPAKRSDPRRSFYRRLMARGWVAFMTWALNVGIGARPPESVFDPASSPLRAIARLFGSSGDGSDIREGFVGSSVEDMNVARLIEVLNNDIDPAELEKVRQDCWVLSQAHKGSGLICLILSAAWRYLPARAGILPALIQMHRSPDHQDSLFEAITRHFNAHKAASI